VWSPFSTDHIVKSAHYLQNLNCKQYTTEFVRSYLRERLEFKLNHDDVRFETYYRDYLWMWRQYNSCCANFTLEIYMYPSPLRSSSRSFVSESENISTLDLAICSPIVLSINWFINWSTSCWLIPNSFFRQFMVLVGITI
jgi:hypothetical protein